MIKNNQADNLRDLINGVGIGTMVILTAAGVMAFTISCQKKVESGYVDQSKLEIKATDFNNNKENETILKYKGESYLFEEDKTGKPVAIPYSVVPQQIVPQYEGK